MSQYDRYYSFSKPLIESLKQTLYTDIESQALVQDPNRKNSNSLSGDVNSLISIKGNVEVKNEVRSFTGYMILSFPEPTFLKIVAHKEKTSEPISEVNEAMLKYAEEIAQSILELSIVELATEFENLNNSEVKVCTSNNLNFDYPLPGEVVVMEVISKFGLFEIEFSYIEK